MLQCREGWVFAMCDIAAQYCFVICLLVVRFLFLFSSVPFIPYHLTLPQQPQLGNLLQVNRTLGRNVPLASQLILMPNGAVAAVQQEVPPTQSPGVHADTDQVSDTPSQSPPLPLLSITSHSGLCPSHPCVAD